MEEAEMNKNLEIARVFFENIGLPFYMFHWPADALQGLEKDPLFLYKMFDELVTAAGLENTYTFTSDMTSTVTLDDGTHFAAVIMPEPVPGQCGAILLFADRDYDYPAYFVVLRGTEEKPWGLFGIDYEGTYVDFGAVASEEEAYERAQSLYTKSRQGG